MVVVQSSFWSQESRTSVAGVFRNEVFVRAGENAGAMEPNAHHKAKYWDDDDSGSFMVEWKMDIKSAMINGNGDQDRQRSLKLEINW